MGNEKNEEEELSAGLLECACISSFRNTRFSLAMQ
jgi:hypothetical protein